MHARIYIPQPHQAFPVCTDVRDVVVDCAFISLDRPIQRVARRRGRKRYAVTDPGFNLGAFFVVIPGHQLDRRQLLAGVVETVDFSKRLQPRLTTLLAHDAVRAPTRQRVVESFVGCAYGLLVPEWHSRVVKTFQIANAVISCRRHYPGVASIAEFVRESAVVLEKKNRL